MNIKTSQQLQVSKIKILSLDGREITSLQSNEITQIDVSDLSQGIYILQMEFENVKGVIYKRLLKNKIQKNQKKALSTDKAFF